MRNTRLKRGAGILMPVSSLPSPGGIGTFGKAAYEFADALKKAGQGYWQVLPLGPTGFGDSPYQSFSAFAGNPYFIDLDILEEERLLTRAEIDACPWGEAAGEVSYDVLYDHRFELLKKAFQRSGHRETEQFCRFVREQEHWLSDYCLYMALKRRFDQKAWTDWDEDIRFRRPEALSRYRKELAQEMDYWSFLQFKFEEQWSKLKQYVRSLSISVIGDIPIYVAADSADVWSNPGLFQLDKETLLPIEVSGVPPDAFSDLGQLWGNPLYDWKIMEDDGFDWWKRRMAASARRYDVVRIDHFIGVVQYYAIPYGAEDARNGRWRTGPGKKLTDAIGAVLEDNRIIAEDLGIYSPPVKELLKETGYPGMKILEFAFSGDRMNEHLPHCYEPNSVVYGGTHDNETLSGFFKEGERGPGELSYACGYLGTEDRDQLAEQVFRTAYASVASVALFQMQDVLRLGNEARMNTPGTVGKNWRWRMLPGQFGGREIQHLAFLTDIYGRL